METEQRLEADFNILDSLLPLLKWRWAIAIGCALAVASGLAHVLTREPLYTASAQFIPSGALGREGSGLEEISGFRGKEWDRVTIQGMMVKYYDVVLRTRPLIDKVLARKFQTVERGEVALIDTFDIKSEDADYRAHVAFLRFKSNLEVSGTGGKILKVSFTSSDARLSAAVVNALLEEYIRQPQSATKRAKDEVLLIEDQMTTLRLQLQQVESQVVSAGDKWLDTNSEAQVRKARLMREKSALDTEIEAMTTELARARFRVIQTQNESAGEIEIVDEALAPLTKSNFSGKKILALCAMVSFFALAGAAMVFEYFRGLYRANSRHEFWRLMKRATGEALVLGIVVVAVGALLVFFFKT